MVTPWNVYVLYLLVSEVEKSKNIVVESLLLEVSCGC